MKQKIFPGRPLIYVCINVILCIAK